MKEVLFPQVTSIGGARPEPADRKPDAAKVGPSEFDQMLLKFSAHASQRVKERNIAMDAPMMSKLHQAMNRADEKGLEEALVLTPDAAFIVNVKNRTVVTALDRGQMTDNVFTNIDGAVVV